MTTEIMNLKTNYIVQGTGERTVLFLHGWAAPITLYQKIFDKLAAMGYRVVAFDMPGVGGTAEPPAPLTVADYVGFTLEFCRKLDISRCIIMCHSHGGRIALSMLSDSACPVKCQKAVLIGATGVVLPKPAGFKLRQSALKAAKALGTGRLTAPLFGPLYQEMRLKAASDDYRAASPVMRQTMNNVLPADFQAVMPQIKANVLLVWGENDTAAPPQCGKVMEELIPGAGMAMIKNAGHFCFNDNWAQFSAVLDAFL